MNKGYKLLDGQVRARRHPATFEVPSLEELKALRPGDYVKVCVERVGGIRVVPGERFWVRLTSVTKAGSRRHYMPYLHGLVEQTDMLFDKAHGVKHGDDISFDGQNVLEVMKQEESTQYQDLARN